MGAGMGEEPPAAALVTGAAVRIGRAIALGLARNGWAVAVHYNHSAAEARAVVAKVTDSGGRAVALAADLADEAQAAELVPRAKAEIGPLTCLVNNAAVFERDSFATATRDSWDLHMAVNLRAPLVLAQAFAGQLPEGAAGNIVNLIDQRVWNLTSHFLSYTVSKAGLWALTRTLALTLAPRIRVNAIGPGPTLPSRRQTRARFTAQAASVPLGRGATPEQICDALRFLLAAPAVTGQMIALDGGQHLGWTQPKRSETSEE